MMDWQRLMSSKRYRGRGELRQDPPTTEVRTSFTKDIDRIVFCPYLRRLQDKTQVHLGPRIDVVRTRLTHSLEVSSVGRSLGTAAGRHIVKTRGLLDLEASDFGTVVAAACLAHDIGNPPFGHAGEEAIQHWFVEQAPDTLLHCLSAETRSDLEGFEGNAQGFRILTRLAGGREYGGLRLTAATLGAFLKYPVPSADSQQEGKPRNRKFSFYRDDAQAFEAVVADLGLLPRASSDGYCRHPLAYLVEAADDICYLIADLEDAFDAGILSAGEVEELLRQVVPASTLGNLSTIELAGDRISYLRAKAIGILIDQAVDVFLRNENAMLEGNGPGKGLLSSAACAEQVQRIKALSKDRLYFEARNLESEIAGYEVVHGLLDTYVTALFAKEQALARKMPAAAKYAKVYRLLGSPEVGTNRYKWLLGVTDHIANMTDGAAVETYRRLKGISVGPRPTR